MGERCCCALCRAGCWLGCILRIGLIVSISVCDEFGVFSLITCVSCLSAESHEGVLVELAGLVVAGFEDGCASHRRFGGGDYAEVFAGDAE